MKKLNLHDMYQFGKTLAPLSRITNESKLSAFSFDLYFARETLTSLTSESSVLLSTSRRAAGKVIEAINTVLPKEIQDVARIDEAQVVGWQAHGITHAFTELESVLGNDMPDIAGYLVSQKGIYRTADLIEHAENHLTAEVRAILPEQAAFDLRQAGKCLAYELAIACAFHLWRAVETMAEAYYQTLTGKTFEDAEIQLNWGQYIIALNKASADQKITVFLDHIRSAYRNPQTHPTEQISIEEAQRLFGVASSSIDQMALAIQTLRSKVGAKASTGAAAAPLTLLSQISP